MSTTFTLSKCIRVPPTVCGTNILSPVWPRRRPSPQRADTYSCGRLRVPAVRLMLPMFWVSSASLLWCFSVPYLGQRLMCRGPAWFIAGAPTLERPSARFHVTASALAVMKAIQWGAPRRNVTGKPLRPGALSPTRCTLHAAEDARMAARCVPGGPVMAIHPYRSTRLADQYARS